MDQEDKGYTEAELEEMLRPDVGARITGIIGKSIVVALIVGLVVLASWTIFTLVRNKTIALSYCVLMYCHVIQIVCAYLIRGGEDDVSTSRIMNFLSLSGFAFVAFFFLGESALGEYVELDYEDAESRFYGELNYYLVGPCVAAGFFAYIPGLIAGTYLIVYNSLVKPFLKSMLLSSYKDLKSSEFNKLNEICNKGLSFNKLLEYAYWEAVGIFVFFIFFVFYYRAEVICYLPYLFDVSCGLILAFCVIEALLKIVYIIRIKIVVKSCRSRTSILSHYEMGLLQSLLICSPKEIKTIRGKNEKQRQEWIRQEVSEMW